MKLTKTLSLLLIFTCFIGCQDDDGEVPEVIISGVTEVTATTAQISANITFSGSSPVNEYGVCWSTTNPPTVSDNTAVNQNTWLGEFTESITPLIGATQYYVRAYAINEEGIAYSQTQSLKTQGAQPTILNPFVLKNCPPLATIRARVLSNKISTNVYFEYGTTTEYELGRIGEVSDIGESEAIEVPLEGLIPNTTYHFRVVAENSAGTTVSEDISFVSQYVLGQEHIGGIVAYVDETGLHGFVSRTTYENGNFDISRIASWGPNEVTGADGLEIGDGKPNTEKAMEINGTTLSHMYFISTYGQSVNQDWYMPSLEELKIIQQNIYENGFGAFPGIDYWSSSEVDKDSVQCLNFSTNNVFVGRKQIDYVSVGISYF